MLGLQKAGKTEIIKDMVDNFAYLIEKYGFIPNGNRTYYLTRSQPPFFTSMVKLLSEMKGHEDKLVQTLPQIQREYQYWMSSESKEEVLKQKQAQERGEKAYQKVVFLPKP